MKLRLWFSGAVFLLVAIIAQAQDFVSKYMDENAGDSTLTRISVSPKMMEEILESICRHVDSNVRELEGAMVSLLAQATFNHRDLTPEVVQEILGKMVKDQKQELTVERIQEAVCEYFNIAPDVLQSKTRKREVVQARQLAMYFCKNYTNASLASIGKQIGKKDHTTVLYACKAVTDLLETNRTFRNQVNELQQKLHCRS